MKKIKKKHSIPTPLPLLLRDVPLPMTHTQKSVTMRFDDRPEPGLFTLDIQYHPLEAQTGDGTMDPTSMAHVLARMAHEFLNIVLRQIPTDEKGTPLDAAPDAQAMDAAANVIVKPRLVN